VRPAFFLPQPAEEVERPLETGIFAGQRYEVIGGELMDKMVQNPQQAFTIGLVLERLARVFGSSRKRIQLTMEAAGGDRERSVREPDLAVLREEKGEHQRRYPRGDETLALAEIAGPGAAFDLSRKATL
jgi:hypothetical protein